MLFMLLKARVLKYSLNTSINKSISLSYAGTKAYLDNTEDPNLQKTRIINLT